MKNLKLLFLSLFIVAFWALPKTSNSQAIIDGPAIIEMPGTIAITVDGTKAVLHDEGRVVITPSLNLQLKITADLSNYFEEEYLSSIKGKKKITLERVAVRVYGKNDPYKGYHYEAENVNAQIDSDGMAKIVVNWQFDDALLDW